VAGVAQQPTHILKPSRLGDCGAQVDFLRPYDLIERILTPTTGRRKLLARLGSEAEDGIKTPCSRRRCRY